MTWLRTAIRWILEAGLNVALFSPIIVVVVLAVSVDRPPLPSASTETAERQRSEETGNAPSHAEAAAAAERAARLSPGMFGGLDDVRNYFLVCTGELSVLTPPARQKRCFAYGLALSVYFDLMRPYVAPEELGRYERAVVDRLEALGWKVGEDVAYQPLGVR